MEDLLKEILYELKEIKKEIKGNASNPVEVKLLIGEDVITENVINSINNKTRISRKTTIAV